MFEHDYRAKFDEIAPDRALVERTRDRMKAVLSGEKARPRRLTRRGLLAVAAAVLTVSALAAGPTLWQAIRNDLGSRAPYATEVEAACEDQGVRIEAVRALADGRMVRVYFTARDLGGNRLDETTQISCSLMRTDRDVWPYGSYSVRQLSYDPDSRTCLFVLTATGRERVPEGAVLCLDVERLLGGYQSNGLESQKNRFPVPGHRTAPPSCCPNRNWKAPLPLEGRFPLWRLALQRMAISMCGYAPPIVRFGRT